MPGKYTKGALVQFMEAFLLPTPNIIDFQINPDQITHTWEDAKLDSVDWGNVKNPLATKGYPKEKFEFTISMDAYEPAAAGNDPGLAKATGLYPRLAALEMLQYPVSEAGKGIAVKGGLDRSLFRQTQGVFGKRSFSVPVPFTRMTVDVPLAIPKMQLPTVLFVWGPGRVLPVRVTKLNITEKAYDTNLNPVKADVVIALDVLTPDELAYVNGPLRSVARGAYVWSQWQRQALAAANYANTFQWIAGMVS